MSDRRSSEADILEGVDLQEVLEAGAKEVSGGEANVAIGIVASGSVCRIWQCQGRQ